jgi:[acyl-carrier-protein] S-malonyltransferase
MTLAVTFPGQGSQAIGMGRALADAHAECRAVFEEVDEALGQKLSQIMWQGPEEQLTLTANAQPALMAVSIAAMRALSLRGFDLTQKSAFVAGHSLGEYSALCAAGSLSLDDTARLLRIRGNAMQAAVPVGRGAMAAILGLDQLAVEAACAEAGDCQIANDNGGGQLVISGTKEGVAKAGEIALAKGAKRALALPVSAPFHSILMQPAADAMAQALAKVTISAPSVAVIANVTARPVRDPQEIRARLVEQVTGRVRWRETVEWLAANGVTKLLEAGSGKVLSGLARRIARDVATISVGAPGDIDAALAAIG